MISILIYIPTLDSDIIIAIVVEVINIAVLITHLKKPKAQITNFLTPAFVLIESFPLTLQMDTQQNTEQCMQPRYN